MVTEQKERQTGDVIGRFAPTPSGRLHLGNLMCAMLAYLSVRKQGGRFLLRIEDLDTVRCPFMGENALHLLDDLAWLGIDHDGEILWQSQRTEIYAHYFKMLEEKGLIYPCYCTRAELHAAEAPHRSDGTVPYGRKCLVRMREGIAPPEGRRPAYRVLVPNREYAVQDLLQGRYAENLERDSSDFIVRRSDGIYGYQLAVVIDDALCGVNEIVRGNDLLDSTPKQIFLQETLDFATPVYRHIPLLTDAAGRRLSKRDGDGCMERVRALYRDPAPVIGALAAALGIIPEPCPMQLADLVPLFDWQKIPIESVALPEGF